MDTLLQELRQAARSLLRSPGLSGTAILTLALGIGATTAIFSVVHGVLIEPLPYRQPDRLAIVWSAMDATGYQRAPISGPELTDLRERSRSFESFGSIWSTTAALVEDGNSEVLRIGLVTWDFLPTLGAEPLRGRAFESADEGDGSEPTVMLSDGLWRSRFAADESILGRRLTIDGGWGFPGGTYTVIGVMPPDFELHLPADSGVPRTPDVYIPFDFNLADGNRFTYYLRTIGRLATGVTVEQGNEEIVRLGETIESEHTGYAESGRSFDAIALHDDTVRDVKPAVLALLGAVSFVLLIACTNVANLLLVRATDRRREISVRTALGAPAWRIATQLLTESLILAAAGGALGIVTARWGLDLLVTLMPQGMAQAGALAVDLPVLGFAIAISLIAGVVFGLAPLVDALELRSSGGLRATGRSAVGSGGQRVRNLLIVGEVALSIILLIGAALTTRTFLQLLEVDPGFQSDNVLTFRLNLPPQRYAGQGSIAALADELETRLGGLPGVVEVGAVNQLPLDDLPNWSTPFQYRGAPEDAAFEADARVVTPRYLSAIGARLAGGRWFDERDHAESRPVVIVDESLAALAWPDRDPVGQELEIAVWKGRQRGFEPTWCEVVGVVEHLRHRDLTRQVREQIYVPFSQGARNQMAVTVRASKDPLNLVGPIRSELSRLDSALAASEFRTMGAYVDGARSGQRFTMILAGLFSTIALFLAGVGLYGVIAWSVGRRTREIGLRVALGARPRTIFADVVGRGLKLTVAGVVVGLIGATFLTRLISGLLFGVQPWDPLTFVTVPFLVVTVALLACWLPARRATHVDPVVALRSE